MRKLKIRYSRKKIFAGLFLFLCIFGIGIGYALVNTDLDILGVATIKDAKWNVHFNNYVLENGSVEENTSPTITDTSISFSAKVNVPGEFYGFTIDVVNEGTINAVISSFTLTPDFSDITYIDSSITYMDGTPVGIGDVLPAGRSKKIKVLLEYKDGLESEIYPTEDQSYNVTLSLSYVQYSGIEADFQTDSWDDIIVAYNTRKTGNLESAMRNGTTREVELDLDHDPITPTTVAHLRIANLSQPSECSTEGFSQSACGLVLELADIIDTHRMNPYDNGAEILGDGNKGGWEYSDMRAYLNGTTYTAGNIDYSGIGIIDALPHDLRNSIINTTVVSGHGTSDNTNFITSDRLYLLSTYEIWENVLSDSSYSNTKQLDYYINGGTPIKTGGSNWWLRSPIGGYAFCTVSSSGNNINKGSNNEYGVSPAFRIAE